MDLKGVPLPKTCSDHPSQQLEKGVRGGAIGSLLQPWGRRCVTRRSVLSQSKCLCLATCQNPRSAVI